MNPDVCIVGGGPAGVVLALQLARRGVVVTLLEGSSSYKRLFRGESMQPDTVGIFHELGIADRLSEHGYMETHQLEVVERGRTLLRVNYRNRPYRHRFIMDVPQPVLLEALHEQLARYSNCIVMRGAVCTGLLEREGKVAGVTYSWDGSSGDLEARWVIGADGRYSRVREVSGLKYLKVPMKRDFVWFKVPIPDGWEETTAKIMLAGANHLVLLPTFPYLFRAGVNIPKGTFLEMKQKGIEAFFELITQIDPSLARHVREHVHGWNDVNMLEIFTVTMKSWWRDGLLLIGDAAHTVSPILGQGVNLAIQDAMELAPMFADAKASGCADRQLFSRFQAKRQPVIDFVLKVQLRQEKFLSSESSLVQMMRRLNYALLNKSSFLQSYMVDRLAYRRQRLLGDMRG